MSKDNCYILITISVLFLLSMLSFSYIYSNHTKNIEDRFNNTLSNYVSITKNLIDDTLIDKQVITNQYTNTIIINNQLLIEDDLIQNFKTIFNMNTKILESSMSEIMKNSNDILSFWFAFLSVIMIVFTFAGIFINNNILDNSRKQLFTIAKEETSKLIEENNQNIQLTTSISFANQAELNKNYNLAIENYDKIINIINPLLEKYDKTTLVYSNYLKTYLEALLKRGICKNNLDQYEEAIQDYDEVIKLDKNNADAYYNRAISKTKLGKNEEANKDYYNAQKLNSNYNNTKIS